MAEPDRQPQEARQALALGLRLYREGLFREARVELEHACRVAPDAGAAYSALGRVLLDSDEIEQARDALLHATDLGAGDEPTLYALGEALFRSREFARAAGYFEQVAALAGEGGTRSATNAAVCRFHAGDVTRAESDLEALTRRYPDDCDLVVALARVRSARPGDGWKDARASLEDLLSRDPDELAARYELAMILARAKDSHPEVRDVAVRELELVRASRGFPHLVPDAFMVHFALGSLYDDCPAMREAAEAEYRAALGLRPVFGPALTNLGALMERVGRTPEAVSFFARGAAAAPPCPAAIRNLARLLTDQELADESLAALHEALDIPAPRTRIALSLIEAAIDKAQADGNAALCESVHRLKNLAGVLAGRLMGATRGQRDDTDMAAATDLAETLYAELNKLLGFIRPVDPNPEVVSAGVLASQVAAMVRAAAPSGVSVECEVPDNPLPVRVDAERVRDLLTHLARNSLDAMPAGGTLTFTAGPSGRRHGWVAIGVSDTGHGIPREMIAEVVGPRISSREGGSGLGLWICERIARAHGGVLEIESEEGRGTRVRLELPPPEHPLALERAVRLRRPVMEDFGPLSMEVADQEPSAPGLAGEGWTHE